jgi:molecular chaperone HtpG
LLIAHGITFPDDLLCNAEALTICRTKRENMTRTIISELQRRAIDDTHPDSAVAKTLEVLSDDLVKDAANHLSQIAVQHPGFDIHDKTHAETVVKNMEKILGNDGIAERSVFELFLLRVSAYAHDCAMALPNWELAYLEMTEGVRKDDLDNAKPGVQNDLLPILKFEDARAFVRDHEEDACGTFEDCMEWLFSPKEEQAFVDDLAERVREYQEYRNGFSEELRGASKTRKAFAARSEEMRQDFVRQTHWMRIERWSRNLDEMFNERLGGQWGKALAHDLGTVSRCHGEHGDFIAGMEENATYQGSSKTNLRLVGILLRLADIVHFTPDRAPLILYREKRITSPLSRSHWDVKNEGLNCSIETENDGIRVIRYSAYFQVPALYFMFEDYLGWIDHELALYNQHFGDREVANSLCLPALRAQVDRSSIRHDPEKFEPVPGLKFTLNQRRVLELLMGVKLYKDKFACLRELYQNSLDACRCALAAAESGAKAEIEFGIDFDYASKTPILYCRDSGIGMTRDVVSQYLLQIGNSFYNSSEFSQLAMSWNSSFTPTSQFGIGILSCFMIADRLEVVSVPLPSSSEDSKPICFVVDGPHENFYYRPPSQVDIEAIGARGTLIKLFLSDPEASEANVEIGTNLLMMQHLGNSCEHLSGFEDDWRRWKNHLYRHVSAFVKQPAPGVPVIVRLADGQKMKVTSATTPFDHRRLGIGDDIVERAENVEKPFRRKDSEYGYLDVVEHVRAVELSVEHEGVCFSTVIALPLNGFTLPSTSLRKIDAVGANSGVLVDGVVIGNTHTPHRNGYAEFLAQAGVMNFTGRIRPSLSVDRTAVVEWPKCLEDVSERLASLFVEELLRVIDSHSDAEGLSHDSPELVALWDSTMRRFGFLTGSLIKRLIRQGDTSITLGDLALLIPDVSGLASFASSPEVTIPSYQFHSLSVRSKLMVLGKLSAADDVSYNSESLTLTGTGFSGLAYEDGSEVFRYYHYLFRADQWYGSLAHFEIVTSAWPVVSPQLYDRMDDRAGCQTVINNRCSRFESMGNGIPAVSKIDPRLIHGKLGIFEDEKPAFRPSTHSPVHRFERAKNNFWLWEIQPDKAENPENFSYMLSAFIAPVPLSKEDNAVLERYRADDSEFVTGVEEGWSVLFLGEEDLNGVCVPGVASRQELIESVPPDFWETHSNKKFLFLDGTSARSMLE